MPSVWSSHDTYLGHYRRYTRQTLTRLLMQAGFQPTRVYYLYGGFFPLVYLKRKLRKAVHDTDLQNHPVWINRMLLQYHTLEMRIARFNTFFGLTCVAEGFIPV